TYRHFAETLKPIVMKLAQGGSPLDIQIDGLKNQISSLQDVEGSQESMKLMPNFNDGTPEPASNESVDDRLKRVFKNWAKVTGFGIGNLPGSGSSSGERQAVIKSVYKALSEPDPANVLNHVGDMFTTSLHDSQIVDLMKQVHRERKHPGSVVNSTPPIKVPSADVPKKKPYDRVGKQMSSVNVPKEHAKQVRDVINKAFNKSGPGAKYELRTE
ncbi:MAG: hypothetical protein KY428_11095, partial [Bacteroidetes bacterium]|nr:hypothetical protein [Bacteroidota bacterium]